LETIKAIQENTAKELLKQRSEIWSTLDKKLEDLKL
jgi:flagellar motor switch protein FliM